MAGQPPNEEGEDSGMHSLQESYLDQILRSLKSEHEEISAAPSPAASTHDASAAAGSSSYATRMPPGSSSNIQAAPPDQLGGSGGGSAGSVLNPWPFISSSASRHPATGVPRSLQTKQEADKQESEQLYPDVVDTPGSSSSFHRDLQFMSEFPAWFIQDEGLEQQGAGVVVGGSQIPGAGPSSYSSRFSDRPEDVEFVAGRPPESFDAQLGNFRMSSSSAGLDAAAQAAAGRRSRSSTAVQPTSSESLYGAGPPQGRMWQPSSLESISSMQQTPIPAAAPRAGPRGSADAVEPPATAGVAARGRSTTMNPETPTSSLSLGSSSEGDDDAERRSSSRGRHQTAASPAAEEGASSAKRKTPERSLEEAGGEEQSTKSGSESKRLHQHSLNRPRKKGGAKRVREPRYAIKTRTDVDIMDDGFKWRKYGQKAVKNSPHPRNYYRCTTPNCPVRKRVERSCEDSGLVITTYEGTHTHQTPGFHRSSPSHGFFGERPVLGLGGGLFAPPHSGFQGPGGFPGSSHMAPGLAGLNFPAPSNFASLQHSAAARGPGTSGLVGLGAAAPGQQLVDQSAAPSLEGASTSSISSQEGFLRARRSLLGLQESFVVKQEPMQFTAGSHQDFLSRSSSSGLPQLIPRQMQQGQGQAAAGIRSAPDSSSAAMFQLARQRQLQQAGGSGSASGSSAQAGPFTALIQQQQQQQTQRQMITNPGPSGGQQLQGESGSSLLSRARAGSPGQETISTRGDRNPSSSSNTLISLQAAAAAGSHHHQQQQQQQQQQQLDFVRSVTLNMQRSQQDIRQQLLGADRQQQQQQAAARLNILRSSSSGGAGGQQISEESLQKSSQEISRGATDQGLLEDIVRPGLGQGPPPAPPGLQLKSRLEKPTIHVAVLASSLT